MKNQLPLSFIVPKNAEFDSYIAGNNQQLVDSLEDEHEPLIFIWGAKGSGKSHLLQSIVTQYQAKGLNSLYLPLTLDNDVTPQLLEGLEVMDLICLDDVDQVIGHRDWEEALFHFFNRVRDNQGRLILAAKQSAINLVIQLPDLQSRLTWGLTYQVNSLTDKEKIVALQLHANQRGVEITDEVANYLLKRATRDMKDLIQLLEKLDYQSLAEQRKLTIPFIKRYL
jgi:DnaA family protein